MRWIVICLLTVIGLTSPARADDDPWAVRAHGLVTRLGLAHTPGPTAASGWLFGVGYQIEMERLAFEVGVAVDRVEPKTWSSSRYGGGWVLRDRLAARASYLVRLDGARLTLGGGLGIGANRVYASEANSDVVNDYNEESAHAALRAGIVVNSAPAVGVDVGVRLPLSWIDTPQSPAWWPTFDVAISLGFGNARTPAAAKTEVVVADVAAAALLWVGGLAWFAEVTGDCGDFCPDRVGDGMMAFGGAIFGIGAPAILAASGDARGAWRSVVYRAAVVGAFGMLGALSGDEDGFVVGARFGAVLGSLAAPFVDYHFAK